MHIFMAGHLQLHMNGSMSNFVNFQAGEEEEEVGYQMNGTNILLIGFHVVYCVPNIIIFIANMTGSILTLPSRFDYNISIKRRKESAS